MPGLLTRLQHRHCGYRQLTKEDESSNLAGSGPTYPSHTRASWVVQVLVTMASLSISFLLGKQSSQCRIQISEADPRSCQPNINLPLQSHMFVYNDTFGAAPSSSSNSAWSSLFPTQGGFFRHPSIAPQRSAFAVFHQLHCLDAIRQGYWDLVKPSAMREVRTFDPHEDMPFMTSPPHVSHCIDLIRNALVCRPDTTVELKDEEIGGVTGFGTEHQCVDWTYFVDWVTQWETYLQEPKQDYGDDGGKDTPKSAGHMHSRHGHDVPTS